MIDIEWFQTLAIKKQNNWELAFSGVPKKLHKGEKVNDKSESDRGA